MSSTRQYIPMRGRNARHGATQCMPAARPQRVVLRPLLECIHSLQAHLNMTTFSKIDFALEREACLLEKNKR